MANDGKGGERSGRFLGMPYDWRRPTRKRLRSRAWNAEDPKVLTPKTYGWGYGVNFRALWRKLTGR
jgi:hypothetical protein